MVNIFYCNGSYFTNSDAAVTDDVAWSILSIAMVVTSPTLMLQSSMSYSTNSDVAVIDDVAWSILSIAMVVTPPTLMLQSSMTLHGQYCLLQW